LTPKQETGVSEMKATISRRLGRIEPKGACVQCRHHYSWRHACLRAPDFGIAAYPYSCVEMIRDGAPCAGQVLFEPREIDVTGLVDEPAPKEAAWLSYQVYDRARTNEPDHWVLSVVGENQVVGTCGTHVPFDGKVARELSDAQFYELQQAIQATVRKNRRKLAARTAEFRASKAA